LGIARGERNRAYANPSTSQKGKVVQHTLSTMGASKNKSHPGMNPGPDEGAQDEDRSKDKSDGGTDDPQEERSGNPKRKRKLKMENRGGGTSKEVGPLVAQGR
jgi:hypothetical protein